MDPKEFPIANKIFQALAEIASVLTIPLLITIIFDTKHESKTKKFTTETVKSDSNGFAHYEKVNHSDSEEVNMVDKKNKTVLIFLIFLISVIIKIQRKNHLGIRSPKWFSVRLF